MSDNSAPSLSDISGSSEASSVASNVTAGKRLADTVRSTLGPNGLDKMLVADGTVVVTNDGASILDRLDVAHPAARLIVEVAESQETRAGDGTTTAVVLAGELLAQAESLIEDGLHPATIANGFRVASSTARAHLPSLTVPVDVDDPDVLRDVARTVVTGKWDDEGTAFLADRAVEAVEAVGNDGRVGFEKITRKTITGGTFYDSTVIDGLVIDLNESSTDVVSPGALPGSYADANVALIDEELSVETPTGLGAVTPETPADLAALRDHEREVYEGYAEAIVEAGADVVFCQQSIDDPVRYLLADRGVLAVERTRRDELRKLARATGGRAVTIENLTPATVGYASTVERRSVGPTDVVVVSGFDAVDQVSLLFRGGTAHVADETKRKLDDCLFVLKLAIEDEALLPGGGATELALASHVRETATDHRGREQLAVEAFGDALESVPRTLAASAGMDPIDALVSLRQAHADGAWTTGLALDEGEPAEMDARGVLEPLHVKRQAVVSAAAAASAILRIDRTISVPERTPEGTDHDHDHEDDRGLVHSTDGYPWAVGHSMGHDQ
jgi:chaperonin GroEL (HSP60 family)